MLRLNLTSRIGIALLITATLLGAPGLAEETEADREKQNEEQPRLGLAEQPMS